MLTLTISGIVCELETSSGLPGLRVQVFDRESRYVDLLGPAYTGPAGRFEITCSPADLRDFLDARPDLYLKIFPPGGEEPFFISEQPVRWDGWNLEDFDVRIPHAILSEAQGGLAQERGMHFFADDGSEREDYDVGEPLILQVSGVRPASAYDVILREAGGDELFASRLLSSASGEIERGVLWPQMGLDDPRSGESFSLAKAQDRWRNRVLLVQVKEGERAIMERDVRFAERFTRPLVFSSDEEGLLLNGFEAGDRPAYVCGYRIGAAERIRVFLVPRRYFWRPGEMFAPARLRSGRPAYVDIDLRPEQETFLARLADEDEVQSGAYDFIVRQLRYGYEDDEDFRLRATDRVAYRHQTGLVVRQEFMQSKTVLGGCVNSLPVSGRRLLGAPYFQYTNTFQIGEDIYGALDPAALPPGKLGKMVALYLIQHPLPQTVNGPGGLPIPLPWDRKLHHLPVLGGNAAVQKLKTQAGCINFNTRLLWPNATLEGEYDIVVDFGNNVADAASFLPDAKFDPPLDIIDGYFKAGFRVVPDPAVHSEFPYAGSFLYDEYTYGTNSYSHLEWVLSGGTYTQVPVSIQVPMRAKVFFPADSQNAATPAQLSARAPAYPMVVMVHGQGQFYTGYDALLEHFAKNGLIAAAIHCENGMYGMDRARLLFDHLNIFKGKFGARMLPLLGLMGHSRGGEAVVIAARLNQEEGRGYHFGAIASLAPTSQFGYQNAAGVTQPASLEGLWAAPYQVIYGALDEDVTGGPSHGTGFGLYDRARDARRCMVFVYGATHNGFIGSGPNFSICKQASSTGGCTQYTLGQGADKTQLLLPATQELIVKAYAMAFFRQHLAGDTRWAEMLKGEWLPAAVRQAEGGKARVFVQYGEESDSVFPQAGTFIIDDFEGAHTPTSWQTSTLGGSVSDDGTLTSAPDESALYPADSYSPHETSGLILRWQDLSDHLRFSIPQAYRNISNFAAISFRITQRFGSASNPAGQPQDLYISLADGNGNSRAVRVSKFASIPEPQEREAAELTKSALCTVRIPLAVFTIEVINTQRVDLTNVTSISFLFGINASGEVEIDSLELVV